MRAKLMGAKVLPGIVGLLLAWGGTALLVSPLALSARNSSPARTALVGQVGLWLLCAAVLGVVLFWEKQPLRSLWFRPLQWPSFAWGGLLVLAYLIVIFPATEWIRARSGLSGFAAGMESALALPNWLRIFAVLTGGVVEEVLFRGYAVTRLLQLMGHPVLAVGLASFVFAALHFPVWGAGPALMFFVSGLATTTFFVWRRDLLAMIIAHVVIDGWALLIAPAISIWWQ